MPLQYNGYEYQSGPYGDSFNGKAGSMAPGAITNQTTQGQGPAAAPNVKGSPSAAFKQSSMEWGSPSPFSGTPPPQPGAPPPSMDPSMLARVLGGGSPNAAQPQAPFHAPGSMGTNDVGGGTVPQNFQFNPGMANGAPDPNQFKLGKPSQDTPINPSTQNIYGAGNPGNVPPALWNDVDRYVQTAKAQGFDYSFLYQHPEWVTDFRNWSLKNDPSGKVDIVDWLAHAHPEAAHGLSGRSGTDTYVTWTTQQHPPNPNGPPGPPTVPPPNLPPPPNTPGPNLNPDLSGLRSQLEQLYGPDFQRQQSDLANVLRGQAALTGDSNSGGFGDVLGRQEGNLIGQQGKQIADQLGQAREGDLNRALQFYGIQSNNDLQGWMEQNRGLLQKYGIDANSIMQAYQAQLQLQGTQYSANNSFNIAAMQAALQQYGIDTQNNQFWGNLNLNRYGMDQNAQIAYLYALMQAGLSPDQLAQILAGFTPGMVYKPPGT